MRPLVVDPYAEALCGERGLALGGELEHEGRAHDAIVVRTRMIDERIAAAIAVDGVRRVLLLGAGLDARPLRMTFPAGVVWREVDLEETIAWKRARLAELPAPGVDHALVALDLRDTDAVGRLLDELTHHAPVLVVLEGVMPYLAPERADALLAVLARRPTRIVCDVGGGTWGATAGARIARVVSSRGAPFRTRVHEPRVYFEARGYDLLSDVSLVDWDASRGDRRFRAPWTARFLPGYRDAARVVEAVSRGPWS